MRVLYHVSSSVELLHCLVVLVRLDHLCSCSHYAAQALPSNIVHSMSVASSRGKKTHRVEEELLSVGGCSKAALAKVLSRVHNHDLLVSDIGSVARSTTTNRFAKTIHDVGCTPTPIRPAA